MLPRTGLALVLTAALAGAAYGATFTVDTTADGFDPIPGDGICGAGACTLRAAVGEANALPGADAVDVPAGTYVLGGAVTVSESVTVTGAGAGVTIVDGHDTSGLFIGLSGATLALRQLTLRNGRSDVGGCAFGQSLLLADAVVESCHATLAGGGIAMTSGTILRTTVRHNTTGALAPNVAILSGEVRDSTIYGNPPFTAFGGSGLLAFGGGAVTVANTTVDAGIASTGFCTTPDFTSCTAGSDVTLSNVTAARVERIDLGGPTSAGVVTVRNSILSSCSGGLVSGGHNIAAGSTCWAAPDPTDVVADPLLGPLQDNGGPTETRAVLAPSPAIDAGDPGLPGSGGTACEATDQRGVARPVGAGCDVGAFESTCGDGVLDAGETCDDGNPTSGDGCDANCTPTGCGNGIASGSEDCDDGNLTGGDCCDATCTFEPLHGTCPGDGNPCTDDVCDAAGGCTHPDNTAPCSDGNPCTSGDTCANGSCVAPSGCAPCLACTPSGCQPPTDDVCAVPDPGGATLRLKHGTTDARDAASFRWTTSTPLATGLFGDPLLVDGHRLCVYDGTGAVVVAADAPAGSGWSATAKGFVYRSADGTPDGRRTLVLRGGGSGRVKATGRGDDLGLAPLGLVLPVRARVENRLGAPCWSATFDAGIGANTATRFRARSQ